MKSVLTNLSNKLYEDSRFRLNQSAKKAGIDIIESYDFDDLKDSSFYAEHKAILDQPKGMGYWSWKPYIIQETMKKLSEGDIVIYCDAGIEILESLEPLIRICAESEPVLLFANGNFNNSLWTTRDCFVIMDCDNEANWTATHVDASFCLFRKSAEAGNFLNEWLKYCVDPRIMKESPNECGKPDLPDFIEFRWDQSILSLLAQRHKISLYRMPSQFGNHYKAQEYRVKNEFNCVNQLKQKQVSYYAQQPYMNSPYGQLLDHHRGRNGEVRQTDFIKEIKDRVASLRRRLKF